MSFSFLLLFSIQKRHLKSNNKRFHESRQSNFDHNATLQVSYIVHLHLREASLHPLAMLQISINISGRELMMFNVRKM